VIITLEYDESSLGGLDEESLLLMYWDESLSQWIDGACGPYDRHPADDWLSVPICHLSEFALVIPPTFSIYLPLISR
jgi:hypothetical protein